MKYLSQFVKVAVTKIPYWAAYRTFLTVLEAERKAPAGMGSGEDLLPGSLCPHMAEELGAVWGL